GYPAGLSSEFEGRSVVVWDLSDVGVLASVRDGDDNGVSLGYTITVPNGTGDGGALVGENYENTAGIVSFTIESNSGENVTLVPTGAGAIADDVEGLPVPGADTWDISDIHLPHPKVDKRVVSTEITETGDVNNPNGA